MQDKRLKYLTVGVLTLAIINIVLISFMFLVPKHRPPHEGMRPSKEHNRGARFLTQELGLSKSQQKAFRELFQEHKRKKEEIEKSIRKTKISLAKAAIGTQNETISSDSLINQIGQLHMQIEMEMFSHFERMRELCDEKQLEKFSEVISKIHHKRKRMGM
ncbi:MAG: periplasmic heavy metal sensor [Cyclobacteriaceae bacterium]